MFNWDTDYEDLVSAGAGASIAKLSSGANDTREGEAQHLSTLLKKPRSLVCMLALACFLVIPDRVDMPFDDSIALFSGDPSLITRAHTPDQIPTDLLVYQPDQSRVFIAGLRRASDSDLITYAAYSAADLALAGEGLVPFLKDALRLTQHEIQLRGLVSAQIIPFDMQLTLQGPHAMAPVMTPGMQGRR